MHLSSGILTTQACGKSRNGLDRYVPDAGGCLNEPSQDLTRVRTYIDGKVARSQDATNYCRRLQVVPIVLGFGTEDVNDGGLRAVERLGAAVKQSW